MSVIKHNTINTKKFPNTFAGRTGNRLGINFLNKFIIQFKNDLILVR